MKRKASYYSAIWQIIRTGHWITEQVNHELKEFGISEPQYNVLKTLSSRNFRAMTVQEIQNHMVQRTSNVTRLIDKLIDKGLVNREENPSNRRKMDIAITVKGYNILVLLEKKVKIFHKPMTKNLTEKEAKKLTELILKLKGI